jgi:MFS family permease
MDENLDEAAIHELESVLHTKIYPGTEIMRDVGTHHFVKSGTGHHDVLVPQPSDDPADPLNWSPLWKGITIFCALGLSFSLNLGPLALAPMFGFYIDEWQRSLADVIQFTAVAILCLGFSNFIWVPVMVCFGRRPVAIFSQLVCFATAIWRARATFMGASILNGLAAGPCETLMPQVIADVIFLHDRGKYQTLYFAMYFISLMIGPIISGAMANNYGWRSFWWFYVGFTLFFFLCNLLLFPETRYNREFVDQPATGTLAGVRAAGNGAVAEDSDEKNDGPRRASHGDDAARNGAGHDGIVEVEDRATVVQNEKINTRNTGGLAPQLTRDDPSLGRGRPTWAQFAVWQRYEGNFFRELWLPLYLHAFPIVEFAAFVVSWSASGYLVVNLSQTQVFAAPPYNYSSQTIGDFNIALFIGGLFGLFTCGPLSDWVAAKLTDRNNGVREPEMRLVAMIPYVLIMILGSIVVAVGYDDTWPWQAIVIVGYSCLGLQVAALPSIASTYAIDSYKPITGSMFVTITINKNLWGYGVG